MTDAHDGDDAGAQAEYDGDPELQALLTEAAESPTVHRDRPDHHADDVDDAHRQRVHDSTQRLLNKHADLIQRLREDGAGDGNNADPDPTTV